MLQWMYGEFGLVGTLLLSYLFFTLFIFWISGLAGINESRNSDKLKVNMLLVGIFFPPYPILWLIKEIFVQHRILKKGKYGGHL